MEFAASSIVMSTLLFLGISAGLIILEIFLARMERWWPGLLPPLFTFLWALLLSLLNVAFIRGSIWMCIVTVLFALLLFNVPTYVLLAVYFICREKRKKKKMLDKMNIQDLN